MVICCFQVMNNYAKATDLSQQADDIEAATAKDIADKSANVVMFESGIPLDSSQDDVAVIMVSQALSSIGTIESANTSALNLFGYTKRDMCGKNINIIVPFPLAGAHDGYLMTFVSTGRSVR